MEWLAASAKGEAMNRNRTAIRWLVLALVILCFSAASFAQVFVSVRIGPPALPIYAQPICPGPGFIWTPGYWAWNDNGGYYWVPGTWVMAPVGMFWTPGYWGWGGGFYAWHPGYWGPHVGFYGGINYGYGYTGVGFVGGEWRGRNFYYNRSVTNVSVTNVTNVYNKTVVVNNTTVNNVSYNGGTGGIQRRPMPQEEAAEREHHLEPIAMQTQHERLAAQNRQNFAEENHGRPAIAATARVGEFGGRSVIPARAAGGEYHAPAMSPREARGPATNGNRPFTPGNSNNLNRPMGGQEKGSTNGGFRPFTPPNSNNPNSTKPLDRTPGTGPTYQDRGNTKTTPTYQEHGNSGANPMYEPKAKTVNPGSNPPPSHTSQPAPQPRNANPPPHRENAPPPHKQNGPKDDHHKGR